MQMQEKLKTDDMNLKIKSKHQFFAEKYPDQLDIIKLSNGEMYLKIKQIELLFPEKFDDYLAEQCKNTNYRPTYPKACQYFDNYGYKEPEDFEKDMVLDIENIKWYSFSYLCPFIAKYDNVLSRQLLDFYKSKIILSI